MPVLTLYMVRVHATSGDIDDRLETDDYFRALKEKKEWETCLFVDSVEILSREIWD